MRPDLTPDLSWHVPRLHLAPPPRPFLKRELHRPLRLKLRHPERIHARPAPAPDQPYDVAIAA